MADEEEVKTEVVEEQPVPDTAQSELPLETEAETPAEETPVEAKVETPAEPKPETDWRDKELKAKHRQNKDLQRALEEERHKREAAEALAAKFNQSTPQPEAVPVDEVERRAQQLVAQQRYVEDCNKAANAGDKLFGSDWKTAIENLELKGGFDEQTMKGIIATSRKFGTEAPAKILFELGKDPNRYDALMALPYEERIIEMAELVRQPAQAKPVSSAPAPVTPIGGKSVPSATLADGQTDDQWYAIRLAQKRKRWESQHSPRR